ncbi:MAG: hypothetical protein ACI4O7_01910 [Aristaeellaceae bacterium]
MPYFDHSNKPEERHRRAFYQPVVDDPDEDDGDYDEDDGQMPEDGVYPDEEAMTDEERRLARRDRWRVLAGVGDFLAVIAGTVVILLLIALLVSLINWVHADLSQSFTLWQTRM